MSRLLFLSRWFPYPPTNGSKLRVYNLLRILAAHHEVTLITFAEPGERVALDGLETICRDVHVIRRKPFVPGQLSARLAALNPRPRFVVETWSDEYASQIRRELEQTHYDAVIASQFDTAAYASCFAGHPALFEEVELGLMHGQYTGAKDAAHRLRYGLMWTKHSRYLNSLLEHFAAATVASVQERALLRNTAPGFDAIEIVPNCVDLPEYAGLMVEPELGSLIFTGAFTYHANYEAASWFVNEVYPHVKVQYPAARLTITGDHAGLPFPPAPDVTLTGFVADVRPLIAGAWAAIVPMRQGGGTRLKILEAMALGVPVIATSKGAEGLDAEPGRHLLVADEPAEFAETVVQLLRSPARRQSLVEEALHLVARRYDWQVVAPQFLALIDRVMSPRGPSSPLDRVGSERRTLTDSRS
jgi:glycosyltransferase involved in cell wall biosynthesis